MSKRTILLINGRWVRFDEIISMKTRQAADPAVPETVDLVWARKGKPSMVYRAAGYAELTTRRSGRQVIALKNPGVDFA